MSPASIPLKRIGGGNKVENGLVLSVFEFVTLPMIKKI